MKLQSNLFFFIVFKIYPFFVIAVEIQIKPLLLIICYDGFRNDYLDRGITPTLNNFKDNGVTTPFLKTIYPALAVPALFSIATGLYPQNHGLLLRENAKADGSEQVKVDDPKMFTRNKTAPIWAINEKNGGKSACIMWPGGESNYEGVGKCSMNMKYDRTKTLKDRADEMVKYLNKTDGVPNLIMFYVEELDRITHFFGHLSRNSTLFIRRLDLLTKYILKKLTELHVYHRTNIVILSDHGMVPIRTKGVIEEDEKKFDLKSGVSSSNIEDDVNGVHFVQLANDQFEQYTFAVEEFHKLSRQKHKFHLVKIPPNFNVTTSHIQYAACPNWIFNLEKWKLAKYQELYSSIYTTKFKLQDPKDVEDKAYGAHGYLRQNDAIFMAKGPSFAMFKCVEPFEMVDLYSAFTKILNIKGDFENDGNFSRVLPILNIHKPIYWPAILITIAGMAVIFTLTFYCFVEYLLRATSYGNKDEDVNKDDADVNKDEKETASETGTT